MHDSRLENSSIVLRGAETELKDWKFQTESFALEGRAAFLQKEFARFSFQHQSLLLSLNQFYASFLFQAESTWSSDLCCSVVLQLIDGLAIPESF